MGLYLCVFCDDEELEGVEVGSYADFERFRNCVTEYLEQGSPGRRFPTLMNHADSHGEWTPAECETLKAELAEIAAGLRQLPPAPFAADWQQEVANSLGLELKSLDESFIDVDGEPLLERLEQLCDIAIQRQCPILFQ
ncbi:Imm70 family immunity protein [Blastopirellula marina]|uniref:Uncharacterized protein n=1 Tax=Blastopirellula marina TaxID=124 RepID=A0A2S8G726_9BACT|nr:Imm70 family immunity protein [Blastopirellula marina]PQO40051.1 hypothetical protein C5Y98_06980 [Blastopirellula marina]PTL45426.1 hypothetical protein C5Y97_06980 [Blastopirellula marina]